MPKIRLGHYSIRTNDLDASRRFYTEALGLRVGFRPPFNFPGLWLYADEDETDFGVVHIIGTDGESADSLKDYLGDRASDTESGGGVIDHMAFIANDFAGTKERLARLQLDYTERAVPSLNLSQIFVLDPSGVTIELNFPD